MRSILIVLALAFAGAACTMDREPSPGEPPGADCPRIYESTSRHRLAYDCQPFCPVIEAECTPAEVDACVADVGRAFDCATLQVALEGCRCE